VHERRDDPVAVVRRNPRHEAAWLELAELALAQGELQVAARAVSSYAGCLPRDRLHHAVTLLNTTHAMDKNLALDDSSTTIAAGASSQLHFPDERSVITGCGCGWS